MKGILRMLIKMVSSRTSESLQGFSFKKFFFAGFTMRVKQKKFDVERRKVWALVLFRMPKKKGNRHSHLKNARKKRWQHKFKDPYDAYGKIFEEDFEECCFFVSLGACFLLLSSLAFLLLSFSLSHIACCCFHFLPLLLLILVFLFFRAFPKSSKKT